MRIQHLVATLALAASMSAGCDRTENAAEKASPNRPAAVTATPEAPARITPADPGHAAGAQARAPSDAARVAEDPADKDKGGGAVNMDEAKKIYKERCATCHGANGKGDGVASASLNPKPRDYTDKAWQASVDDEHLRETIIGGGVAVGKSAMMPPNPDLKGKPEVVGGLVKIIRDFAK